MEEQLKNNILSSIHRANRQPYGQESVTEIIGTIRPTHQDYLRFIKDNFWDVVDEVAILEGPEIAKICQAHRQQIKPILSILTTVELEKISSLSAEEITKKLNQELIRQGAGVQFRVSSEIAEIIRKIQTLESTIRAIRLVKIYDHTMEIYPYCKKYAFETKEKLMNDLDSLEKTAGDIKFFIDDEKRATKLAIDYLMTKDYPAVLLQGKDGPELLNILERHYLAALAVLAVKEKNRTENIQNQNDLIDGIALFLLDQEDLTETD